MKKRVGKVLLFYLLIITIIIVGTKLITIIKYRCPINYLFHIKCTGCGRTRMLLSIMNLDIIKAFEYNPAMFIVFILAILDSIYISYYYIKNDKVKLPGKKTLLIILILLILYMPLRNILNI